MKKITPHTSLYLMFPVFLFFTSCHLFESTQVSTKEIAKASEWSAQDIAPSFDVCEGLEGNDNEVCFKELIITTVSDYLNNNIPEANRQIEEVLLLTITVDKEGYVSLKDVDFSNAILEAIPNLNNILVDAIYQLPQAKPAIKSNVGSFVVAEFQLPIRIVAQELN